MASIPSPQEIEYQVLHASDSRVPQIIAVNAVCFTIACTAVILRFAARRIANVNYGADDWLIVVGLFFTLGVVITSLLGIRFGAGRHVILIKDPVGFVKLLLSAEVLWGWAITPVKLSILVLYYRIFAFNNRPFTYVLSAVGIFVICYCLTQTFASLFTCMPISSNWNPTKPHHCANTVLGGTIVASLNVLTDFVILLLPMPILYKLHKPMAQKLQIMGIFLLGGLVCVASIIRTVTLHDISYTDPTWSDVSPDIWTIVELCTGILSACLPSMRPLISRNKYLSKYRLGSGSGSGGSGSAKTQEKLGSQSNQGLARQQSNSIPSMPDSPTLTASQSPSQTEEFSHLGVLGKEEPKLEV